MKAEGIFGTVRQTLLSDAQLWPLGGHGLLLPTAPSRGDLTWHASGRRGSRCQTRHSSVPSGRAVASAALAAAACVACHVGAKGVGGGTRWVSRAARSARSTCHAQRDSDPAMHASPPAPQRSCPRSSAVAPTMATAPPASLDRCGPELRAFAMMELPRRQDREAKMRLLALVTAAARHVLSGSARVLPYGSSVTGCGAGRSDVDAVLYDDSVLEDNRRPASWILQEVGNACEQIGLRVSDFRPHARIPVITLEMLCPDGAYPCDLTYQNLLPLRNTWLLRSFTEREPRLGLVSMAVKRWAKKEGICSTTDGYISGYAWTLMVVYYFQIEVGLSVLHSGGDITNHGTRPDRDVYDGAGVLLQGFFDFYAQHYQWGKEVVSIWNPDRRAIDDVELFDDRFRSQPRMHLWPDGVLHIQDPVEISRNLNFALTQRALDHLRERLNAAHQELSKPPDCGEGLCGLLSLGEPSSSHTIGDSGAEMVTPHLIEGLLPASPLIAQEDDSDDYDYFKDDDDNEPLLCACCLVVCYGMYDLQCHQLASGHEGVVATPCFDLKDAKHDLLRAEARLARAAAQTMADERMVGRTATARGKLKGKDRPRKGKSSRKTRGRGR